MVTRVYSRAAGRMPQAKPERFLMDVLGALPFPLLSVQVDGSSEFMAGFEDACEKPRVRCTSCRPGVPMERLRGAGKPLGADRVLGPLRRVR